MNTGLNCSACLLKKLWEKLPPNKVSEPYRVTFKNSFKYKFFKTHPSRIVFFCFCYDQWGLKFGHKRHLKRVHWDSCPRDDKILSPMFGFIHPFGLIRIHPDAMISYYGVAMSLGRSVIPWWEVQVKCSRRSWFLGSLGWAISRLRITRAWARADFLKTNFFYICLLCWFFISKIELSRKCPSDWLALGQHWAKKRC